MYVKQFQKNCFHFRFLHNKPQIALLTTELSLLTCFISIIINPLNDDCATLSHRQSISSTPMSLKDATYLSWLIIMKYVWRNKLYKCWTVHNRERYKWPGPSYLYPNTNTGLQNSSLLLIFLWDDNLGSRMWESLKGVLTGSNSFFNGRFVKLDFSPPPSFYCCHHITLLKAA